MEWQQAGLSLARTLGAEGAALFVPCGEQSATQVNRSHCSRLDRACCRGFLGEGPQQHTLWDYGAQREAEPLQLAALLAEPASNGGPEMCSRAAASSVALTDKEEVDVEGIWG